MLTVILCIITFIVGIYAYLFYRPFYFLPIIEIVLITIVNEGIVIPYVISNKHYTSVFYNIFSLLDMAVFSYIFLRIYSNSTIKKYIKWAIVLVYLYTFTEFFFLKGWKYFHTDSFRFYEILIIILSLLYLYNLLKREYYIVSIDPVFWLCCACLVYHSILIINFTTKADEAYWHLKNAHLAYILLQNIANTSYYLLLCCMFISGICYAKWQKKKTSSRK